MNPVARRTMPFCARNCADLIVIVTGDNQRRLPGEFGNTLENALWRIARKIGSQLVVDSQIRGKCEKFIDAAFRVQTRDKRSPPPRLAHTRRQRETGRWKFQFKIFWHRKSGSQRGKNGGYVSFLLPCFWRSVQGCFQLRQRFGLWRAQRQASVGGKSWRYLRMPHDEVVASKRRADFLRFEIVDVQKSLAP
jgi:hypothetical protein